MFGLMKGRAVLFVMVVMGLAVLGAVVGFPVVAQDGVAELEGEEGEVVPQGMSLMDTIRAGGTIMWIIFACSVATLALIIEHILSMRMIKVLPQEFVDRLRGLLEANNVPELLNAAREAGGFLGNVIAAAAERHGQGKEAVTEAVQDAGSKEVSSLNQKISYLSIIAVLSPMLGLLGTVMGMIRTFSVIAMGAGLASPARLAEGVSQALVTTAAGLMVAIPAMGAYFYFRNRVQGITVAVEDASAEFVKAMIEG